MNIVGIGGSVHDFSACVLRDGKLIVAIEEERLSRRKHHPVRGLSRTELGLECVEYCLDAAELERTDVDLVVGNDLLHAGVAREAGLEPKHMFGHHLSHAASVYFTTCPSECPILVVDGFGSIRNARAETISYFLGSGADVYLLSQRSGRVMLKSPMRPLSWQNLDLVEDSIGYFYSIVCEEIGLAEFAEGSMMALAAFGDDRYRRVLCGYVNVFPFLFRYEDACSLRSLIRREMSAQADEEKKFEASAAFAHAAQQIVEDALVACARDLLSRTGGKSLAVSGGVFLNCVANRKIEEACDLENLYIFGACGDAGTAVGSAYLAYVGSADRPTVERDVKGSMYAGRSYPQEMIRTALASTPGIAYKSVDDPVSVAAEELSSGSIVAWFQGRSEFGPRALGNRSFLADPSSVSRGKRLSRIVKKREWYRPLAPAILETRLGEVVEGARTSYNMTTSAPISAPWSGRMTAALHVDGSCRYQSVARANNERFFDLISRFAALTGVPALLNTSFNIDCPIVETPVHAVDTFVASSADVLLIDDFVARKQECSGNASRLCESRR